MTNVKPLKRKAFSLIELAIAGLVISILIAGIMQGRSLIGKSRIANARTMTVNSPVAAMEDVILWYETTLEKSFGDLTVENGAQVNTWYDINFDKDAPRNNAVTDTTYTHPTNPPTYHTNKIGELPALSFDGTDDALGFDGSGLILNEYTIFVVEQRTSNKSTNLFIGGDPAGQPHNSVLGLGYVSDTELIIAYYYASWDTDCDAYTEPIPTIHSYTYNFDETKYYLNGDKKTLDIRYDNGYLDYIKSFNQASVGKYGSNYYQGDLGEVIIVGKYLKTEERKSIERYLGKKWGIEVADD